MSGRDRAFFSGATWQSGAARVCDVANSRMPPDQAPPYEAPAVASSRGVALELEPPHDASAAALDLKVARRMFYGGFAGLPWLWFIAWLHFRRAANLPSADPQLAKYARRSGVGALVGAALFACWIVYVQLSWRSWGDFGRSLMLVVPEDPEEL